VGTSSSARSTRDLCPVYMVFFQAMQLLASAACDMQHVQCSCASSVPDHLGEQALIRASRMRKILPIAPCTLPRNGDSGGGKRSSDKSSASLSMISAAAVTAAARAAQELYNTTTTPAPSKQAPPLFEVSHFTMQSSPAESTLTPAHTQHPQAAAHVPVNIFGND
jgi:hypothetical protein